MKNIIVSSTICFAALFPASAMQATTMCNGDKAEQAALRDSTIKNETIGSLLWGKTNKIDKTKYAVTQEDNPDTGASEKNYFPRIAIYPRVAVGFHATPSGYKDSYDLDWGGFYWSADCNVLFPSTNTVAASIGLGVSKLNGDMKMLYEQGGKHHNDKIGSCSATYLTIPLEIWYKGSDWFMFGVGNRFEILTSQKADGKKAKDMFNGFRDNLLFDGICTIGKFDVGAQLSLNLTKAFKDNDLDWSPTIGISFTAGYRF